MRKAKSEFLEFAHGKSIKCAIAYSYKDGKKTTHKLKVGFTDKQFLEFVLSLDFTEYDLASNYFRLHRPLSGKLWFNDNTWASKAATRSYQSMWVHKKPPAIPKLIK